MEDHKHPEGLVSYHRPSTELPPRICHTLMGGHTERVQIGVLCCSLLIDSCE